MKNIKNIILLNIFMILLFSPIALATDVQEDSKETIDVQSEKIENSIEETAVSNIPNVKYQIHGAGYGWQDWKSNGELGGTINQDKRVEGIKIELENVPDDIKDSLNILYQVHGAGYGWQEWKSNGELGGTTRNFQTYGSNTN